MKAHLLPYQIPHLQRIVGTLQRARVALDASDPGVGKTYVACAAAREGGWKLAVVAPKATLPAWQRVAEAFGVDVLLITNYEAVKRGKSGFGWFEEKHFNWCFPPDALLVFDEAQRCKARNSQNAELLIAARRQRIRTLLCSATAASNPLEMRAIGYALGLHCLFDFWPWTIEHGCGKGRFGFEFSGDREVLARLHRRIFEESQIGARLRVADIPDFPETQIIAEPIGTGHERQIQAVYDEMKHDLNRALGMDDRPTLHELAERMEAAKANHLTILLRARQRIEQFKANAMAAIAQDAAAEDQSVALVVNFDETIDVLAKSLGTKCVIRGGQNENERQRSIARFQENKEPFVILNIRAGGVGISLHDPAGVKPRLSLISPTFSAQDLRQALGRVHRSGGAHSIQRIIFAAGTCEEQACDAVAAKLAHIDLLNDGDLVPSAAFL